MLFIPNYWPDKLTLIESYCVQIMLTKFWRSGKYDCIIHLSESMDSNRVSDSPESTN